MLLSTNAANFRNRHRPFPPSHNLLSTKEYGHSFVVRFNSFCCNARMSHRFKAFSPPSCAKNRVRLVPSENSAIIFSDRALNRGRRTESRVLFGYFLHNAKSDNPFPLQRTSRFCKPRISALKHQFRTNKIKSFLELSCLLETWSPCSRPFAILPVSAVSDAQKLATGNFLHVRAESCPFLGSILRVLFRRPQRLLFLHVVRRIAAYLLGGGLVKFPIA